MKILYAIQGTGNGHINRATEIAPLLVERLEVDFLLSGLSAELNFPYSFKFKKHGLSFFFGNKGGVNYLKSFRHTKPFRLIKDIISLPVKEYDAILSDFEPISAWAGKKNKVQVIGLSHQAAFYSEKSPRPKRRSRLFEFGMKKIYAPCNSYVGLHYKKYDDNICLPIIRESLMKKSMTNEAHVTVYLPAFSDKLLIDHFSKIKEWSWKVFSKKTDTYYRVGNVEIHPINKQAYDDALCSASALLIGAGFQGTSEGLYCKKKMMVIYEQKCNAAALEQMGVRIETMIEDNFHERLSDWLTEENKCTYHFQPNTNEIVDKIVSLIN